MSNKPWYKSKTKLGSLILAVLSIIQITTGFEPPAGTAEVLVGFIAYGFRDAMQN